MFAFSMPKATLAWPLPFLTLLTVFFPMLSSSFPYEVQTKPFFLPSRQGCRTRLSPLHSSVLLLFLYSMMSLSVDPSGFAGFHWVIQASEVFDSALYYAKLLDPLFCFHTFVLDLASKWL